MAILGFWRQGDWLTRAWLTCAALSAFVNLATYAGLTDQGTGAAVYAIHIAIIALGVITMGRTTRAQAARRRHPDSSGSGWRFPRAIAGLGLVALVYVIILIANTPYEHGWAEWKDGKEALVAGDTVIALLPAGSVAAGGAYMIRIFSAGWLLLSLYLSIFADGYGKTGNYYRSLDNPVA